MLFLSVNFSFILQRTLPAVTYIINLSRKGLAFSQIPPVLRRGKDSGLPTAPVVHRADDFQHFLRQSRVRAATAGYTQATGATTSSQFGLAACTSQPSMMTWHAVSADKVRRIVLSAPTKSCSLDQTPTSAT